MEVDLTKWHRCEVDKKQFSALITPPAKKGLWGAYSEIIPAIIKQSKDPNYKISLSVPN